MPSRNVYVRRRSKRQLQIVSQTITVLAEYQTVGCMLERWKKNKSRWCAHENTEATQVSNTVDRQTMRPFRT